MTAISDKCAQLGGAQGFLGTAVTAEIPAAYGGLKQEFRNHLLALDNGRV